MCTAWETPRGAARLHGWGRGVRKAMRSPWGCRRGNPLVGLLGGQALAPDVPAPTCLPLSQRNSAPSPQGPGQKPERPACQDPHRQQLAIRPAAPSRPVLSALAGGSHSGFLPALSRIPPKGAHPHDPLSPAS